MRFKKVYIEITNRCNLNCSFCIHNKRKIKDLSVSEYKLIIDKIKDYTNEVYLHVLGEPLLHNNIQEFINYANDKKILVNITTNGILIDRIKNNHNIHRLNVSLHSFNNGDIERYLDNIFSYIDSVRDKTFCSLRLWVSNKNTDYMLKYINNRYNSNVLSIHDDMKVKVAPNLIIDTNHEFIWPDMNNNYYSEIGTCKGLIQHIGILSDGTIIPCCLDSMGVINLGNIFRDDLDLVLSKPEVKNMIKGFKENKKVCELCKHCSFLKEKK